MWGWGGGRIEKNMPDNCDNKIRATEVCDVVIKAALGNEGLLYSCHGDEQVSQARHFSDSSRKCWDKNRHEQRTKSYLKKKRVKKKINGCVCHVSGMTWSKRENTLPCEMVERAEWWAYSLFVCAKEIPSFAFVCTATRGAELLTHWPHLCYENIHLYPHHLLSSPVSVWTSHSILHVALELLELCWFTFFF